MCTARAYHTPVLKAKVVLKYKIHVVNTKTKLKATGDSKIPGSGPP